jgi:predicted O-methyltransferase YrrM
MLERLRYDRAPQLARAIDRLRRRAAPGGYSTLWTNAIYGWDNARWSAEERYLAEVVRASEQTKSSILECGSGLTTLLMAAVAARSGVQIHALENNPGWHARVAGAIREFGLTNVTVHLAPLRDFGEFDWYDAPLGSLPNDFGLVVCDGPPAGGRGGRRGTLPIMHEKLVPGCLIMLDDANRPAERELLEQWVRDYGAMPELRPSSRGFARVRLPGA